MNKPAKKSALALTLGTLMGLSTLVGVPTTANAAQITGYDCKTVTKPTANGGAVREKSCMRNVGSLYPIWARVVVSKQYISGGTWV